MISTSTFTNLSFICTDYTYNVILYLVKHFINWRIPPTLHFSFWKQRYSKHLVLQSEGTHGATGRLTRFWLIFRPHLISAAFSVTSELSDFHLISTKGARSHLQRQRYSASAHQIVTIVFCSKGRIMLNRGGIIKLARAALFCMRPFPRWCLFPDGWEGRIWFYYITLRWSLRDACLQRNTPLT